MHKPAPVQATEQTEFKQQLQSLQQRIDQKLDAALPLSNKEPHSLHQAMHYAVKSGGKRIRPILVYATGTALEIPHSSLDASACAVELIHAYSLVHDDLPCMDDDCLRRGQPTCHIAFDEATAVLAGDALQALAFELLSEQTASTVNANTQLEMIKTLATAAGTQGMVVGQAIDLAAVNQQLDLQALENMHQHKTGALIQASVRLAYLHSRLDLQQQQTLDQYAKCIGLAFQVQDDILDVISDTDTLGKTQGADMAHNKPTFVSLLGLEAAQAKAQSLINQALRHLNRFDAKADLLRNIAQYIITRRY